MTGSAEVHVCSLLIDYALAMLHSSIIIKVRLTAGLLCCPLSSLKPHSVLAVYPGRNRGGRRAQDLG